MKKNFVMLGWALLVALVAFSCEKEIVAPESADAPRIANNSTTPEICSPIGALALSDLQGNTDIQYCGFLPCTGSEGPWADVEIYNTDTDIIVDITMSFGWFIRDVSYTTGSANLNGNVPSVGPGWTVETLAVNSGAYSITIPIGNLSGCVDLALGLTAYKQSFFGGEDANSVTELWATSSPASSTSPFVAEYCIETCGPVETVVTDGECRKCDSEVTVTFFDCDNIDISSCKNLSNVVLVYTDGSWQKFDNLSGTTGSFAGTGAHAGKEISHVYVKAGCFKSGEGPGFGRRFDGPCVNP